MAESERIFTRSKPRYRFFDDERKPQYRRMPTDREGSALTQEEPPLFIGHTLVVGAGAVTIATGAIAEITPLAIAGTVASMAGTAKAIYDGEKYRRNRLQS